MCDTRSSQITQDDLMRKLQITHLIVRMWMFDPAFQFGAPFIEVVIFSNIVLHTVQVASKQLRCSM